jgi:hypothetical protein
MSYTREDVEKISVCELKILLHQAGKKTSGTKKILIERFLADVNDPINERRRRGRSPNVNKQKISTVKKSKGRPRAKSVEVKKPRAKSVTTVRSRGRPKKI